MSYRYLSSTYIFFADPSTGITVICICPAMPQIEKLEMYYTTTYLHIFFATLAQPTRNIYLCTLTNFIAYIGRYIKRYYSRKSYYYYYVTT